MSDIIKIRKGLNIRLQGKAEKVFIKADLSEKYAVKPIDFHGLYPKLTVKIGDRVKAGSILFFDKYNPDILFASPVSGTVTEINRGERRKILEIVIEPGKEKEIEYMRFLIGDPSTMSREQVITSMLESGVWPYIRQRPYSTIANPHDTPKSIFISAINTAPLAPDGDYLVKDKNREFQTGINALSKLTSGKIHVNVDGRYPVSRVYSGTKGVQVNKFKGPHPAGNVGVQIHHLDPINKGEIVWYLNPQDVIILGRLFLEGIYDPSKIIALTGSEVLKPRYYKVINGASITNIIEKNVTNVEKRFISGHVLSGKQIPENGYIGFYDNQLTVIPEGRYHEFLGWALPGFSKFSISRTFTSWLRPLNTFKLDTNIHGGERAFVITGLYERVLPMDIYPMQLLKAIMIEDIDLMEKLGIYEIDPEDFALCEFVCPSKIEIQSLIRKGLDMMMKEMS